MKLIEIEPFEWELFQDHDGMYLEVQIYNCAVSWSFSICLDQKAQDNYHHEGKVFIHSLARRIESSLLRRDYKRFYTYSEVTKMQREQMHQAFKKWQDSQC